MRVIFDFEMELSIDPMLLETFDKFPNTRCATVFNDVTCISREFFSCAKQLLKPSGRELILKVSNNLEVRYMMVPSISAGNFDITVNERTCLCHNVLVNKSSLQTHSNGFVCSTTLKLIDQRDTTQVVSMRNDNTLNWPLLATLNSGVETSHSVISIKVISRLALKNVPYELLYGESYFLVPSMEIDVNASERNENNIASLCSALLMKQEGLLCISNADLNMKSLSDSNIQHHFMILPEPEGKCLIIRNIATSDEVLPPVHILSLVNESSIDEMFMLEFDGIDLIEEYNPLMYSSNKMLFAYKSIDYSKKIEEKKNSKPEKRTQIQTVTQQTMQQNTQNPKVSKANTPSMPANLVKKTTLKKLSFK